MKLKRWLCLLLAAVLLFSLAGCAVLGELAEDEILSFPTAAETTSAHGEQQTSEQPETAAQQTEQPELTAEETEQPEAAAQQTEQSGLPEDGCYDDKDSVALYIHQYGHLPQNYITKKEAEALGWPGGSLEPYAPGKCIGGSRFGNYEGLLPEAQGRTYTECDIDTMYAKSRGAKRIVFSNDGLIYYTEDHYESFELLYGGD